MSASASHKASILRILEGLYTLGLRRLKFQSHNEGTLARATVLGLPPETDRPNPAAPA
jgi:hypothetical protein